MSQRVKPKPERNGVSFIITSVSDQKDTWSKAFLCCVSAEECYRKLIEGSPGLKGRIVINKYVNGKHHSEYTV